MKRHWIVVENGQDIVSELDDIFVERNYLTFPSESEAEQRARKLAETNPGKRYSVFALVSSFVVNVLTEERAQ